MSKEVLAKVVQRAIGDANFRRQLSSDPAGALRGFDLSADELSALRTGNAGRLSSLGVDQRMSKAFAIGEAVAATRTAQSDLAAATRSALDDGVAGARTIIPHDPEATTTADLDGSAAATRSALNDDPDGFLAANARASGGTGSVRTGDDWKFADRSIGQASAAPVEGSPEADAAAQALGVGGRIGAARLDDASGSSGGASTINDDPDGFLAANKNADSSGGSALETAFVDESESYLTTVGYDASAASSQQRATWSGDENAGPASVADDDGGASPNATEGGPNINP